MKDEIKEILEDKKQYVEYWESENMWSQQIEYDRKILDYITNLQEENERLKADYGTKAQIERDTYKTRNEKAIAYIKSLCYIESNNEWFTYGDDLSPEHIVNILQGE